VLSKSPFLQDTLQSSLEREETRRSDRASYFEKQKRLLQEHERDEKAKERALRHHERVLTDLDWSISELKVQLRAQVRMFCFTRLIAAFRH